MRTGNCCKIGRVLIMFAVLGLVTVPAALAISIPGEGAHADAFARYQDNSDGPDVVNNPANAEAQALVDPFGEAMPPAYDRAEGHAWANLLGGVGSLSRAGGWTPAQNPLQEDIVANSTAKQVTNWIVTTADPTITTADIDMLMFIDGFLYTGDFAGAGPGNIFGDVSFQANVYTSVRGAVNTVFEATARLDSSTGLSTTGPWGGAFTPGLVDSPSSEKRYEVNYSEFFPAAFTVPTNDPFGWEIVLGTEGYAVGPYEMFATVDFLNSGSFELSTSTPGVTFSRIPEPSTLILLGAGLAGLAGLRRKKLAAF